MLDSTPSNNNVPWLGLSPAALKLLFLAICILFFSIALYVIFIFSLDHVSGLQKRDQYLTKAAQIYAYRLQHQVNERILLLEQHIYMPHYDKTADTDINQKMNHSLDSLQTLIAICHHPQAMQISTALRLSIHHYNKLLAEAIALQHLHTSGEINKSLLNKVALELQPQSTEISSQLDDLITLLQYTVHEESRLAEAKVADLKKLMFVVLVLGGTTAFFLIRNIIWQLIAQRRMVKQQLQLLQVAQQEMQLSQQKLTEKEVNLRGVIDNTSDGVFAINSQYELTVINQVWRDKLAAQGIHLEVGQDCSRMFHTEAAEWKEPFQRALAGEKTVVSSSQQQAAGNIYTEEIYYYPVKDEIGAIQGVAVFVQNVTSRNQTEGQLEKLLEEAYLKTEEIKAQEVLLLNTMAQMQQSQEALQHKEAHLGALINNTDDKIVAIDTHYTITFINTALKEQCARKGIFLSEGSDYRKVFEGIDEKEWKPHYERAFAGEKFILNHVQNVLDEGVLEVAFNPVKNRQDIITGVCVFVHDITQRVKHEQQIQKLYAREQESNEELQAQQEELRQNLEELMSTQEGLEKTQHTLKLKEAKLRALINNTNDAIFSIDTQYNITVLNQVMKEVYQHRYTAINEGANFLKYLPTEKKPLWKEAFDQALQGEHFVTTWEDTPFAEHIYHELSFNPVKTEHDEIIGVSVFIKDVSERKKQELEKARLLKEAEAREEELMAQGEMMRDNLYELMLTRDELEKKEAQLSSQISAIDKSNNIVEFDLEGNILHTNDNFLQLMYYSKEELIGRNYQILIPEEERGSEDNSHLWNKLSIGEFYAGEFKRVTKTGVIVWIKATYNPVLDAQGKPYKIIKFAFDITDRVQDAIEKKSLYEKISLDAEELRMQEEELRQNLEELKLTQEALLQQKEHIQDKEARLRALIDNTEDDIYAIDANYTITILNKSIHKRYEKQGLALQVGYNIFSIIPAAATAYWKVNFDKAMAGEKFSIVDQVITKDGEVYFDVSLNPIRNDKNQVIGVSVLSRNINQYKLAEKENLQTIDVLRKIQERVASMSSDKESEIDEYKKKLELLKKEMNRKIKF